MSELPGPMALLFSAQGGQILTVMVEAMVKANDGHCDCDTCSMLRAASEAFGHLMTNGPSA